MELQLVRREHISDAFAGPSCRSQPGTSLDLLVMSRVRRMTMSQFAGLSSISLRSRDVKFACLGTRFVTRSRRGLNSWWPSQKPSRVLGDPA